MGIGNLAWFLLEEILTNELLIEHILTGLTQFKYETWVKRVRKLNVYLNINVYLGVECAFCSPWQLNLGILTFLNLAQNWDFVFKILGSCLKLRFLLFKFSDLAWNWDVVWINSWFLLEFEIKQEQILNLAW